jgi:flagellar protein FliS
MPLKTPDEPAQSRSCLRRQVALGSGVDPAWAYLEIDLATATPRRLWMLLYDGAVRLCRQAMAALDRSDVQSAADMLARARAILRQLQAVLRCRADPALRQALAGLYDQAHRCLIDADFYRRREAVNQAISLLDYQRPAWGDFLDALGGTEVPCPDPAFHGEWIV